MSDYKDLVSDLLGKAKGLANSEASADVAEKIREAAAASGLTGVLEKGSQRAKNFGTATKAALDLNRDYKELERVFCEIGKLYYEQNADRPEDVFVPLFEQVNTLRDSIIAKNEALETYKTSFEFSSAESQAERSQVPLDLGLNIDEFEAIVNQTENDGTTL